MSDAVPAQPDTQPSRSGRLLALVRGLIDYGKDLIATVRQRITADPIFAKTSFGTADLTVIFARITRGVLLAQALEARVLSRAAALDKGPKPRAARAASRPRPAPTPPTGPPLAEQLPILKQIAAEVRRRPIGAILADIYFNLGILPSHPLWREVQHAMLEFGGSWAKLLKNILDRTFGPFPSAKSLSATPSGAGPP